MEVIKKLVRNEDYNYLKKRISQKESTVDYIKQQIESASQKTRQKKNTPSEQQKTIIRRRILKNEESLRDFWNNIQCINIHIKGAPKEEEEKTRD